MAVARAVRVNRTYEPNPAQHAEKTAVFAEVYPTLKGLNRKLWLGNKTRRYRSKPTKSSGVVGEQSLKFRYS